jgi:pimeloyl-ACP methyl ester carboxylesterase
VARLVLSSVASETPPSSAMASRMGQWIEMAERDDWGMFFSHMALVMRPATGGEAPSFEAAARLQPRPATPERFIAELRATLDPSSFVTDRLGEISVPALVLVGDVDRLTPPASAEAMKRRLPQARMVVLKGAGHCTMLERHDQFNREVDRFLLDALGPDAGPAPSGAGAAGRKRPGAER